MPIPRLTAAMPPYRRFVTGFCLLMLAVLSGAVQAQTNANFNVTVNTGPLPPNAATVFPGEATSLRITLSNNSTDTDLTNVAYSGALATSAIAGLVMNGPSSISGDAGCLGGTLTTTPGQPEIVLSGLTVPRRIDGVPGSGECYLDLPIRGFSTDGASVTRNLVVAPGAVSSDQGTNNTGGPQAITLRAVARPTIAKAFAPNNILVLGGATRTLTITVTNPDSNVSLTQVGFRDVFPTAGAFGAVMEPTGTPATGSCVTGGGVVGLTQGAAAEVTVSGATVPAGGSCTVQVEVRGRQTNGAYQLNATNTIDPASFTSLQGLTPAANASAPAIVRSPLGVAKSFNPIAMASGTQGEFTVTLTNGSGAALPVGNFTDNPIGTPSPGSLLIAAVGDISNSCAGGTTTLESGGQGFSVGGFSIPANGNCQITVRFTGTNSSADTPTSYTNTIPEGAVQITGQPSVISQARTATVIVADRLRVLKARTPASAAPGEAVRYDITVQNFSNAPLSDVGLADTFQNGSTLLTGAGFEPSVTAACGVLNTNGASQGDSSIDFTIPTLPGRTGPGAPGQCVVSLWVMIDPTATAATSNQIPVGGVCFDPGAGEVCNQTASNNVNTALRAPVGFAKTFNGANVVSALEGVPVRLRLEVRNFAPETLSDLVLDDTLPTAGAFQQLRVATPANLSNSCGGNVTAVPGTTSVSLNAGTVAAFNGTNPGVCALEIDVIGPAGTYPNTAQATGNRPNADGSVTPIAPVGNPLTDSATVNYSPALRATKSFTPASAASGAVSTLEIRFQNLDAGQPITGIAATDALPVGMVIASPAVAYSTCAGPPTIDAVSGADTVSISGARLPPGASCALLVDVQVTGTSDWVNTIPAGAITADNGIVSTSPVSATLLYEAPGVPLISKAINPGTIVPGQSATLTIDITNGGQALTGLGVVDWFTVGGLPGAADNGMRIAPAPLASTSCTGGVVTALPGGNNVRLSGAALAANAACAVRVQVTSTTVGTLTNQIPQNAIGSDQGATNSTTFAASTLSTTSEIGIAKLFTPLVVSAGEPSRLRIDFFNGSATAVTDFALTDIYPPGLENAPDPNPISSCGGAASISFPDNSSVRITDGAIGAAVGSNAASCSLEVNVVAAAEGTYDNEIPANSLTVRGVPVTHPPASSTLQVRQRIVANKAIDGLTLDMGNLNGFTTGNAVRLPGVAAPLTIRLQNPNTIALTEVRFTDSLPAGLTLAVPPNVQTTCTDGVASGVPNGVELRLAGAILAPAGSPGAICTVTADVFSNLPGVYTNEIPVGAVVSFQGVTNDPPTQAQLVVSEPPTVAKEFLPPVVGPGVSSTLRITLGNANAVSGTLSTNLIDTLPTSPGAMVVAAAPAISTSCPGGVGIVTAAPGAASVAIASGAVIPPGGCTVSVAVTATEPGDYLNTIPVGALRTSLGTNDVGTQAPLKISTLGYISGKVFLDNQTVPDGSFIPGSSAPIAGNTVELRAGASCGGAVLDSVLTDAQGNYLFTDLPAGTYSVCQPTQPPTTFNSVTSEGTIAPFAGSTGTPGSGANPSALTSQITGIVLGNNGTATEVSGSPDNNFSEVLPASISGNVYFDADNDGVFDAGESGIGGVTIRLSGPVTRTTTTAADGSWSFSDLPPGEYTVTELQPGGWQDGIDTAGTVDGVARGDDASSDVISSITLGPGDAGIDYNFGEIAPAMPMVNATAVCVNSAIYVDYSLAGFDAASSPTVNLRWVTTGGRVAEQRLNQPSNGRILWPGTAVDGAGTGSAWPGWLFADGEWSMVADDRVPDIRLEVDFNGTQSVTLSYPPATASCAAQPRGTFQVQSVPVSPRWMLAFLALALLLIAFGPLRRHA